MEISPRGQPAGSPHMKVKRLIGMHSGDKSAGATRWVAPYESEEVDWHE